MRPLVFLVIAMFYAGVWLALAVLLSIMFRSPATAALVALGIWLFLTVQWPMLAPALPGDRAAGSARCSIGESRIIAWPQTVALIASTVVLS